MATIPDALDIANALEDLAAGLRLDPDAVGIDRLWLCVLSDVTSGETALRRYWAHHARGCR
jgi:hypothetical protein